MNVIDRIMGVYPEQINIDCGNGFTCNAKVRVSNKARRVTFKIDYHLGLEIVVPYKKGIGLNNKINEHLSWIKKNQQLLLEIENSKQKATEYPLLLELRGVGEVWNIIYNDTTHDLGENYHTYHLVCPKVSLAKVHSILTAWLYKRAYGFYAYILQDLVSKTGLRYSQLVLSNPKTRWGSCNSAHKIRLNVGMIFLPQELINYVILHELCHTKKLNHSQQFWQLIEKYNPDYASCERELKQAHKYLPIWLRGGASIA